MLGYNIKIALRNLYRFGTLTVINVAGLAIAAFLLITFFILDEMQFDVFQKDAQRIYQVLLQTRDKEGERILDRVPGPLAEKIALDHPQVEWAAHCTGTSDVTVRVGENLFLEKNRHLPAYSRQQPVPFLSYHHLLCHPKVTLVQTMGWHHGAHIYQVEPRCKSCSFCPANQHSCRTVLS